MTFGNEITIPFSLYIFIHGGEVTVGDEMTILLSLYITWERNAYWYEMAFLFPFIKFMGTK